MKAKFKTDLQFKKQQDTDYQAGTISEGERITRLSDMSNKDLHVSCPLTIFSKKTEAVFFNK